jgi:DNA polymerase III, alpha subunit (gram-positive type)
MTVTELPYRIPDIFQEYEQIILIDVETTGLSIEENQIIELAAVRHYRGTAELNEMRTTILIKLPKGKHIPKEILELTHITDEMLASEGISKRWRQKHFWKYFYRRKKL